MITSNFLLTALVVVLAPGTGVIYTVSTGLFSGWRASIFAAAGCTAGIIPHLLASVFGLAAVLHASALLFSVVKYAGAAYLFYLAWSMWRATGILELEKPSQRSGLIQTAVRGVLLNILNPKLSIFFLAFLPIFVEPEAGLSPIHQMLILSGIFMLMTFVVFVGYGLLASLVSRAVLQRPKIMKRIQQSFALVFAALATRVAVSEQ